MTNFLIADDDPLYLNAFEAAATALGHEVRLSTNKSEAMEVFQSEDFDLVFLDVIMKGGGAITMVHEMNRLKPDVPLVVITGREELLASPLFSNGLNLAQARIRKTSGLAELGMLIQKLLK